VPSNRLYVSAVTAWEYADLQHRGRFPPEADLTQTLELLNATVLDYPAGAWRLAFGLPDLHRDPVDRMLIAHAIHADFTLVSADETIRSYPGRSLW
jgi:PIN domain nuclease of toxin-antitoxin system